MILMVDLWVCPSCNVLLGIEVNYQQKVNCVNCGIDLQFGDIKFIDKNLHINIQKRIYQKIDETFHSIIRFRWLSNKTLGIMIEQDEYEFLDFHPQIYDELEDNLADEFGIVITLIFE